MTRIQAMEKGNKVTHHSFSKEEHILIENGVLKDENGYYMDSDNYKFWYDRTGGSWEYGWLIYGGNHGC